MKVLLVTHQYAKVQDDKVFVSGNTLDIIRRFQKMGDLRLLCCKYKGKSSTKIEAVVDGLSPDMVTFIEHDRVISLPRNRNIIQQTVGSFDLVVGYLPCADASYAISCAYKKGIKTLSYVVGCCWDSIWNHGFPEMLVAPYAYWRLKATLKKSDFALYVTKEFLQRRYPTQGLSVGVSDVAIPRISDEVLSRRLHDLDNRVCDKVVNICTIANNEVKYKGQHLVIEALGRLKKKGDTRYNYYLIGAGNPSRLKKVAEKCNVVSQVHFLGILSHNQIFDELGKMDVYLQPSLQEGLPRSVVEAMSVGLLCIGAKTGGIPELLDGPWLVNRRSVRDIEVSLEGINSQSLREQACVNINKAKAFQDDVLNNERIKFFDEIKKRIDDGRK